MSKLFVPVMTFATFAWIALSFLWPSAWVFASWCAGCACTAWIHSLATTPSSTRTAEQRMEDLVRRMAKADKQEIAVMGTGQAEAYQEARAILAELEPVDADLIEARMTATTPARNTSQTPHSAA